MSRRRTRLHNDLAALVGEVEDLAPVTALVPGVEKRRVEVVRSLREIILPRLAVARPPVVVALIGSTGAGKSTLLNSLAGTPVSATGVLRPTTNSSLYWTSADNAGWLPVAPTARVEISNHPLLDTLVLVDTPDLDSDIIEHRAEAMAVAEQADVVLFIATAARYGDAIAWDTLTQLAATHRLSVVLNRTPTRASGARNDLTARLRRAGLSAVEVFTISEQRVDPAKRRLSPQATQRVAAYLRALTPDDSRIETVADAAAAALREVVEWLEGRNRLTEARSKEIEAEATRLEKALSLRRWPWRRRRDAESSVSAAQRLRATIEPAVDVGSLRHGSQLLAEAEFGGIWSE